MGKRYDFPIPFGWYAVSLARDLAVGEVKPIHYFGKELVLFRSESGEAKLLDAYCPHLGANLAVGGQVKGDCIECPFHQWQFKGECRICWVFVFLCVVARACPPLLSLRVPSTPLVTTLLATVVGDVQATAR